MKRRSKEGEGERCRTGERIEAWPVDAIAEYAKVRCPTCWSSCWVHNVLDIDAGEDAPRGPHEWECEPLSVRSSTKWPRNPYTGRRGFFYEEREDVPDEVVRQLYRELAQRMIAWLRFTGVAR